MPCGVEVRRRRGRVVEERAEACLLEPTRPPPRQPTLAAAVGGKQHHTGVRHGGGDFPEHAYFHPAGSGVITVRHGRHACHVQPQERQAAPGVRGPLASSRLRDGDMETWVRGYSFKFKAVEERIISSGWPHASFVVSRQGDVLVDCTDRLWWYDMGETCRPLSKTIAAISGSLSFCSRKALSHSHSNSLRTLPLVTFLHRLASAAHGHKLLPLDTWIWWWFTCVVLYRFQK